MRSRWARLALLAAALGPAACAAHRAPVPRPVPVATPVPPSSSAAAVAPSGPADDPTAPLLAASVTAEDRGKRELQDGHRREARHDFDDALDLLLTAPPDLRRSSAIHARIEQLVTAVSALELDAFGAQPEPARPDASPLDTVLASPTFAPPDAATTTRVADDLTRTNHDIDIPLNARVLSFVELFTGKLKGFLEEALGRSRRYLPMIQQTLAAEGLPTDLAFIPLVESAFNPAALSKASARGLWQFMRATAIENGLRHDWYVDERVEPERATLAAARYLKSLHDTFGDWHLAIASYNGGPGRVQRAVKRAGKADFWALAATSRYLPKETRDYVPLILAAAIVSRNPGQYGVTVTPGDPLPATETIRVDTAIDLRRLAEALERPVAELQALNPALRRWTTPPGPTGYQLRIPAGTVGRVAAFLASPDAGEDTAFLFHTVRKGDTLLSLSRKLRVKRQDLAEANFLTVRASIRPGQRLIVPREPGGLVPPAPVPAEVTPSKAAPRTAGASATGKAPLIHTVRKGDTLAAIARRYRTTVADLRRWNTIPKGGLTPGDRLTVRPPTSGR